ncbi:MAG: UDP-N-acetylmuramoyl-tripeptide--D-alanyl-D-alanine ligase, partial [Hymenobacteraceae bacterium]|nr:UDP-N-acetylmuramoyl-tripeptide--D-alanyl-D-alanine ligase [Hymenobacteraceae bacterium]MDX5395534.1 UDP-N-acetylmuramoyl-tripeptide--D-alanyl-D-alanine ligase [Hymenobacteraceae bacterium]MDX5511588.1 UDP-N-acetylmuramoyl-tripeptide--D-alanyl-D-alanine ligase [Hymenobacteraceae bacterium]
MYTFPEIAEIIHGRILQHTQQHPLRHLLTDSRKAADAPASLFFAIRSSRNDGHRYVPELYRKGVRQFVVEELHFIPGVKDVEELQHGYPDANFVQVKSSLAALQALAAQHRQQFNIPVVGITGSNGKTIVKEWLAQLLSVEERVVKSPRSFNSQIGVPLSVWQMQPEHTLGIFEAGISRVGEMEKLQQIIQPTHGIFTNIGTAHAEGFESQHQKVEEKLKLFKNVDVLFYCKDYKLIHEAVQAQQIRSFTWSRSGSADLNITSVTAAGGKAVVTYQYQENQNSITLPFADDASVENALHCLAVLLYRQLPQHEIQQRLEKLQPVAMRLEMKEAINNCYLIDDSYNNDLAGLSLALDLLEQQPRSGRRTLILSDLLEQGQDEDALYSHVAQLVAQRHVDRLIGIGPVISRHQLEFKENSEFYISTEAFLEHFQQNQFKNEVILVKGARVFGFERIVQVFQQKVHGTVLEVNLDALVHNLNFYRSKLKPGVKLMVMVKAFAYGSGSYEIANLLQFHRVDYLTVAYADEGVALREHGITLPIMVMNPSPDSFAKLRQYNL